MPTLSNMSRILKVRTAVREKRPLVVLDFSAEREAQQLEAQIADIDRRLTELETLIARETTETYNRMQYTSERNALRASRRGAEDKLRLLTEAPTERQLRIEREQARRLEAAYQRQRRATEEWIEHLEREGDLDQARIYRHQILSGELRRQVEHELR